MIQVFRQRSFHGWSSCLARFTDVMMLFFASQSLALVNNDWISLWWNMTWVTSSNASTCRRHILAIKNRVCIIKKWVVSGMWQSRLVTSWIGLLSPDCRISSCLQPPSPRTQWPRVCLFWPRRSHQESDTCSDAHRVSADCVRLFWPRRPAAAWKMGHMQWCAPREANGFALTPSQSCDGMLDVLPSHGQMRSNKGDKVHIWLDNWCQTVSILSPCQQLSMRCDFSVRLEWPWWTSGSTPWKIS